MCGRGGGGGFEGDEGGLGSGSGEGGGGGGSVCVNNLQRKVWVEQHKVLDTKGQALSGEQDIGFALALVWGRGGGGM